tara:strand:+ start:977 stop:1453 length:477 start_codon:yes stop_codon:yes gene_type:complete
MYYLTTTRFNNETLTQNKEYCKKHNIKSCIYGSPMRIKGNIPVKSDVFVLEMNNSKNKIQGIGLITNFVYCDKRYNIYKDGNYNRYVYKGQNYLDLECLSKIEQEIINVLEILLFKGAKHSKRAQGICEIPLWIKKNKHEFCFVNAVKNMFLKRNLIK